MMQEEQEQDPDAILLSRQSSICTQYSTNPKALKSLDNHTLKSLDNQACGVG
eukprot:Pgem_evm1s19758